MQRSAHVARLVLVLLVSTAVALPAFADLETDLPAITEHLEFMGYEKEEHESVVMFTHGEHLSFTMQSYQGGLLIQSWFTGTDYSRQNVPEFLNVVNDMNAGATTARFYRDDDGDLMIEAWFPGAYEKQKFSSFMDAWIQDSEMQLGANYDRLSNLVE